MNLPPKKSQRHSTTVTGQEIYEEEVSLIQGIQLSDKEDSNLTEDIEASEEEEVNNK